MSVAAPDAVHATAGPSGIALLVVPYDSGRRGWRMGAGPQALLASGAVARVAAGAGMAPSRVQVEVLEPDEAPRAEIRTAFALARVIARAVAAAVARGTPPLVLAGNCNASWGVAAGLHALGDGLGIVWLDAHADLNTPDTTLGGFLDGMGLATLTGRCWRALAASVPGFRAVPDERVLLVGARDLDPGEAELLAASTIGRLDVHEVGPGASTALDGAFDALRAAGARHAYLHVDLDVHDPAHGMANAHAVAGGLAPDAVARVAAGLATRLPVRAAALTAFDPAADADGRARRTALLTLERMGAVLAGAVPS